MTYLEQTLQACRCHQREMDVIPDGTPHAYSSEVVEIEMANITARSRISRSWD